jgi:hypothetical protein
MQDGSVPAEGAAVEAVRCLAQGGRWAEAARVVRLLRAQNGDRHPALAVARPMPSPLDAFMLHVSRCRSFEAAVALLRHVEMSRELRSGVPAATLRGLLNVAADGICALRRDEAAAALAHAMSVVPVSCGALGAVRSAEAVLPDGTLSSSPRLLAEAPIGRLGILRREAHETPPESSVFAEARSVIVVDRSGITHGFNALAAESRHHDAIVVSHSVLLEMAQLAEGLGPGHAAARRNLAMLLAEGANVVVLGWADELAVRIAMPSKYTVLDASLTSHTVAAVALELQGIAGPEHEPLSVAVHTRATNVRKACRRVGVPLLPLTL